MKKNDNYDDEIIALISSLPNSQAGTGRHRCPVYTYEAGINFKDIDSVDMESCKHGNYAPVSVLSSSPDNQGGVGRHKCTICAYAEGLKKSKENRRIEDVINIKISNNVNTQKETLINARLGQGKFRYELIAIEKHCRVTKLDITSLLIASHIKPWRSANNEERLDKNNGLLLSPHIDKLFDLGHITFLEDGSLLSSDFAKKVLPYWSIKASINVGKFNEKQSGYLNWHKENLYLG